ncbi:MAG: signal peptidase I [bacterium]|nr:signal peptidase I [bacterium]
MEPPKKENFIKEVVKFTLIAIIIVVPIRTYIAQPFIVSGASMDPTFVSGEYLIVDQVTYRFEEPKRGDVIIFRYPRNPKTYFIKRIIGLPGETLSVRKGEITIDGTVIDDSQAKQPVPTTDNFDITLGDTEYFVMGDNRSESSDSRIWGPLERKYIVGRPAVSLFPLSKIEVLPGTRKN